MASKRARAEASGSGSGGGARTQPPPYQINLPKAAQRQNLIALDRRELKPTLFYCQFTCEKLGINDQVVKFAQNLGWVLGLSNAE